MKPPIAHNITNILPSSTNPLANLTADDDPTAGLDLPLDPPLGAHTYIDGVIHHPTASDLHHVDFAAISNVALAAPTGACIESCWCKGKEVLVSSLALAQSLDLRPINLSPNFSVAEPRHYIEPRAQTNIARDFVATREDKHDNGDSLAFGHKNGHVVHDLPPISDTICQPHNSKDKHTQPIS
ncbi:unnamed protein product [Ilex paraguariensis]|uniref:Uncharacterized protein n=1 Tax=Ilex paraguariensis TaxID=185542 RepID=A0ABC8RNB6_9AQUA